MREYLHGLGKELADRIKVVTYTPFCQQEELPFGTYIFSDVDRLSGSQSTNVFRRWKVLQEAGCRLLNDPIRSFRRYDLLRWLYENGINDFDCYMVNEHRKPKRFPVFIRRAFDHDGAISDLLPDQAALDAALVEMRASAEWPGDKLITEYVDVGGKERIFRKFAAFRIGDRFIPRQIMARSTWVVKTPELHTPELAAEEAAHLENCPFEDLLMRVFRAARIEYGRVDYSVVDGRIRIFEINTNPSVIGVASTAQLTDPNSLRGPTYRKVMKKYMDALAALDDPRAGDPVPFTP